MSGWEVKSRAGNRTPPTIGEQEKRMIGGSAPGNRAQPQSAMSCKMITTRSDVIAQAAALMGLQGPPDGRTRIRVGSSLGASASSVKP
jgi:hypothetical protein